MAEDSDSSLDKFLEIILYIILAIIVLYVICWIVRKIIIACRKRAFVKSMLDRTLERDASIRTLKKKLPVVNLPQDLIEEILNADVTGLKLMLDQRQVTSEQLLLIFLKRAITIGVDHELITDHNYEEALELAQECDRIRATKYYNTQVGNQEGFLFGIPISIKDMLEMKGFDCNFGCGSMCNKPLAQDGYLVRLLKYQGAIPFIRSNIPQVGFAFESLNLVYGDALNPWNKARTPGGSTGGGAGLIAARCSPLEVGSDLGGSIRAPSNFCGVYGFKPSGRRVTMKGHHVVTRAFDGISGILPATIGPLAKSTDDVILLMRSLLSQSFHNANKFTEGGDGHFKNIPWDEELFTKQNQYRIGYLRNNNFMPVAASYTRAIDETAEALSHYGHDLVEVKIEFMDEILSLFYQVLSADAGLKMFEEAIKEQGFDERLYKNLLLLVSLPVCLKNTVAKLARCMKKPRIAGLMTWTNPKTAHGVLELIRDIKDMKDKFMDWWNLNNLDALIIPNVGMPAFKHGFSGDISVFGVYTMLGNVIDLPCGAVPITVIGENETNYDYILPENNDMISKKAQENLNDSQGMPVGIQVLTPYMEEERCVYLMKQIEERIQFHNQYGYPV